MNLETHYSELIFREFNKGIKAPMMLIKDVKDALNRKGNPIRENFVF